MIKMPAIPKRPSSQNTYLSSSFILRIYSREGYDLQGKIEHIGSGQTQTFEGVGELVRLIQEKLDEVELPQVSSRMRTWR